MDNLDILEYDISPVESIEDRMLEMIDIVKDQIISIIEFVEDEFKKNCLIFLLSWTLSPIISLASNAADFYGFDQATVLDCTEVLESDLAEKFHAKLEEMETLEDNWDGEGSKAVNKTAIKNCQTLLEKLSDIVLSANLRVFPSELGAISIKLVTEKGTLRSEIGDSIFSYYIKKKGSKESEYHSFEEWNESNISNFVASLSNLV